MNTGTLSASHEVKVYCLNCGKSAAIEIEKGMRIRDVLCGVCGTPSLVRE